MSRAADVGHAQLNRIEWNGIKQEIELKCLRPRFFCRGTPTRRCYERNQSRTNYGRHRHESGYVSSDKFDDFDLKNDGNGKWQSDGQPL